MCWCKVILCVCVHTVSENELCQQLNLKLMETEIIDGNPPHSLWFLSSTTEVYVCVLCLEVDEVDPVMYWYFFYLCVCKTMYINNGTLF